MKPWERISHQEMLRNACVQLTMDFMSSHTWNQHCTPQAWMLLSTDDHREQRPQLCGALTGELKTGPWAGNKTLERYRNSVHPSTIATQKTVAPKSPWHHRWPFLQTPWNKAAFKWLGQKALMLTWTKTCQVHNCSYRTVHAWVGWVKLCMASLYSHVKRYYALPKFKFKFYASKHKSSGPFKVF